MAWPTRRHSRFSSLWFSRSILRSAERGMGAFSIQTALMAAFSHPAASCACKRLLGSAPGSPHGAGAAVEVAHPAIGRILRPGGAAAVGSEGGGARAKERREDDEGEYAGHARHSGARVAGLLLDQGP